MQVPLEDHFIARSSDPPSARTDFSAVWSPSLSTMLVFGHRW